MEEIKDYEELDYEDIKHLAEEYSNYVMEFSYEHDNGEMPVCIYEFYENEYQKILNSYEQ